MDVRDYLQRAHKIREERFWSRWEMARMMDMDYHTLAKVEKEPEMSQMRTRRKVKEFVEKWEVK